MSNIAEQVKVLRHGEEMETGRGFYAPASITLIRHPIVHSCYVLVDTGCFGETNLVKNLLKREDVHPNQIRTVYVTHNHPDHIGTIGLFKNSRVYTPDSKFSVREPNYFKLMPQEFYTEPGKPLDVE